MSRVVYSFTARNESSVDPVNLIEGVALNAAAASRTHVLELGREVSKVIATVDLTHSAASVLKCTPTRSLDGTNYDPVPSYSISSGAATMNDFYWTKSVTGDDQLVCELDTRGIEKLKLIVDSTGGGASDTFNLRAVCIGE